MNKLLNYVYNYYCLYDFLIFISTLSFAFVGAQKSFELRLNIFCTFILVFTVSIGGGIFRDLLFGIPIAALQNYSYVIPCAIAIIFIVLLPNMFVSQRMKKFVLYGDAIGLGLFTCVGAEKLININHNTIHAIIAGMLTSCGGGFLKDIFVAQTPFIFKDRFYLLISFCCAILFLCLKHFTIDNVLSFHIISLFALISRVFSSKF